MQLRMPFRLPAIAEGRGQSDRQPARQRAMQGDEEGANSGLLRRWDAAVLQGAEELAHGRSLRTGIARRWSYSAGKGMSSPPASSGAIQTERAPFHCLASTSVAKRASRSAVSAAFSSVK